jgi:hypothetical protein
MQQGHKTGAATISSRTEATIGPYKAGKENDVTASETTEPSPASHSEPEPPKRPLTPEAQRALAEAEDRRRVRDMEAKAAAEQAASELGGRKGPDPVRYGDWENGGIASDF